MIYKYKGRFVIPGIPARDLTDDDLKRKEVKEAGGIDALIASGLYEPEKPKAKSKKDDKEDNS